MALTLSGSALGLGKVLQVVNATYATEVTCTSSTYVDSGLSATITPSSSSSKILVMVTQPVSKNSANADNGVMAQLLRGSTVIQGASLFVYSGTAIVLYGLATFNCLDSPATTSAVTYKTQIRNYFNGATVNAQSFGGTSSITLLEVAP